MSPARSALVLVLMTAAAVAFPRAALAQRGTGWRIPADYERHPALLVGASQMMFHHERTLVDIANALEGHAQVYGLVANEAQARYLRDLLVERGLPADAMQPVIVPVQGMWLRDYGPVFVQDGQGEVGIVDTRYGETEHNPDDDEVPTELAERWHAPVVDSDLWLEGGQILSNGAGLLLISTSLFTRNALRDGIDGAAVTERLRGTLPFTRAEVVRPLEREPTGHLDMFLSFLAADVLLVARIDPADDAVNAARLDEVAARLEGSATGAGPLRVVRVDTPAPRDGVWRTYTNAAMVHDVVLVPSYPDVDPRFDEGALAVFREWMPDRTIVAIDARSLVARKGALHCVSVPIPSDEVRVEPRRREAVQGHVPFFVGTD